MHFFAAFKIIQQYTERDSKVGVWQDGCGYLQKSTIALL